MKRLLITFSITILASMSIFAQYVNKIALKDVNHSGYTHLPQLVVTHSGEYFYSTCKASDTILIWNLDTTLSSRKIVKKIVPKMIDYTNEAKVVKFYPTLHYHKKDSTFMLFYRGYCHVYDLKFNYIKSMRMPIMGAPEVTGIYQSSYNINKTLDCDSMINIEIDTVKNSTNGQDTRYILRLFAKNMKLHSGARLDNPFDAVSSYGGVGPTSGNSQKEPVVENWFSKNDTSYSYSTCNFTKFDGAILGGITSVQNKNKKVSVGQPIFSWNNDRVIVITRYTDQTFNMVVVDRGLFINKKIYRNKNYYNDTLYGNMFNTLVLFDIIPTPDNSFLLSYATFRKGKYYNVDQRDVILTWVVRKMTTEFYRDSISPTRPKTPQFNKNTTLAIRSDILNIYRCDSIPVSLKVRGNEYTVVPTLKGSSYYYAYLTFPYQKADTVLLLKDSSTIITNKIGYPTHKDTTIYSHIKVNVSKSKDTTIKVDKIIKVDTLIVKDVVKDTLIIVNDTVKVDLGYIYLYDNGKSKIKVHGIGNSLKFELIEMSYAEIIVDGYSVKVNDGTMIPIQSKEIKLEYGNSVKYVIRK